MKKKQAIEVVVNKVIDLIESGKGFYRRNWSLRGASNLATGTVYRGFNSYLNLVGNYFLTMKQASELHKDFLKWEKRGNRFYAVDSNGDVLLPVKGAKGYPVIFTEVKYIISEKLQALLGINKKYLSSKELEEHVEGDLDDLGDLADEIKKIWVYRINYVYNVDDLDKKGEYERLIKEDNTVAELTDLAIMRRCIEVVNKVKQYVAIKNCNSNRAYYSVRLHEIVVPSARQFKKITHYYGTLFHEVGHATGKEFGRFDDVTCEYKRAYEEVIAEFVKVRLCGWCGISEEDFIENSAGYIRDWRSYCKDKEDLYKAIVESDKAFYFVMGLLGDKE